MESLYCDVNVNAPKRDELHYLRWWDLPQICHMNQLVQHDISLNGSKSGENVLHPIKLLDQLSLFKLDFQNVY